MWERVGARLERLGREGPGEGKDPGGAAARGSGVSVGSLHLSQGWWGVASGGTLSPAWGPPGVLEEAFPSPGGPTGLTSSPSLSHLTCPPCASHVGAPGWTSCFPDSSSRAETPVLLITVGAKSRQSPLG